MRSHTKIVDLQRDGLNGRMIAPHKSEHTCTLDECAQASQLLRRDPHGVQQRLISSRCSLLCAHAAIAEQLV